MDLSKLPKFSQSPPPPADPEDQASSAETSPSNAPGFSTPQAGVPMDYGRGAGAGVGAEVWISAIIGLIFLMIGWNFARYMGCVLTGQTYHTNVNWTAGPKAGTEVAYPELEGSVFWSESGMFSFGLALLMEAAVLAAVALNARFTKSLIALGWFLAFFATAYNVVVAALLFQRGVLPLMSLLAVAFGGYMAMYLWKLLQSMPSRPASSR
jgi:hypothetical protein